MRAGKVFLSALAAIGAIATPLTKRDNTFPYGSTPVRGANIGGWLLVEPWITPSLFQPLPASVVDEYTLCQQVPNAAQILRSHWDSFVTLADFQKLASNGINTVRIPIGYWAFRKYPGDPYIQGAADYLDVAINWARQTGMKVWIDLHGAPLSQNGFDNSGQVTFTPGWTSGNTVSVTLDVVGDISRKYAGSAYSDVISGIQLMNEPTMATIPGGRYATQNYYSSGFSTVRQFGQSPVIFHDGFDDPSTWNGFLSGQGSAGAILDHHEYQCFSNNLIALSPEEHVSHFYSRADQWAQGQDKFVVCAEWSAAMTDCAPLLNGRNIGARYDGTYSKQLADGTWDTSTYVGSCGAVNSIETWSQYQKASVTNYLRAQLDVYENRIQGWVFWNFKTEGAPEWDLFRLIDHGVWPSSR